MGTEPGSQGSSGGPAGRFRKVSKPLMEKKRRARINVSLEQLRSLLEKHYSHQIRKRKLEKADILELSVKYMRSLQSSVQGLWPEYPPGSRGGPAGVQLRRRGEDGGPAGSTPDSAGPRPEPPPRCGPCAPVPWAPSPGACGSRCPPRRPLLPGGAPGPATTVPAPPPAARPCAPSPGPGLRLWRPW